MTVVSDLVERARLASRAVAGYGSSLLHPTIRLGITGLSRAGKTVFITALVHGLLHGGRFPVFEAWSSGRIARARFAPQPDDAVPRFDYESHIRALTEDRVWPDSTRQISELRLLIEYQSQNGAMRELTLDIVDYPGEWLLDLPLLSKSYEEWASDSLLLSRQPPRAALAANWHRQLATLDPSAPEDERAASKARQIFTDYLRACRQERFAMSLLPPGRFLMAGDLAGSPALTFAPLDLAPGDAPAAGSLWTMMRRRYEAYKDAAVRPFFRDHFARLDRQIVLVDALAALNAGPDALHDLENALATILECFDVGKNSFLRALFAPRIDRILFAATKADHLHHSSHDRLEHILSRMVACAVDRARFAGAAIDVAAIAALRATREAQVKSGRNQLPSIIGVPAAAERAGKTVFDGETEAVIYPGDLPEDAGALFKGAFKGLASGNAEDSDYRFLRFRPPLLGTDVGEGLPHIRLDRTLQFLLGDRLR